VVAVEDTAVAAEVAVLGCETFLVGPSGTLWYVGVNLQIASSECLVVLFGLDG
jgi:hypothetical protein